MNNSTGKDLDLDSELKKVWLAMSELFLDTDIEPLKEHIAKDLASTKYSVSELNTILKEQVAPAVATNLLSVAGVWQGFDQEALFEAILEIKSGKKKKPAFTWLGMRIAKADWDDVLSKVSDIRQKTDSAKD